MRCSNHPKTDAVGACVNCGKLFCQDCLIKSGKKNYCKECLADRLSDAEAEPKGKVVVTQTNNQQVGTAAIPPAAGPSNAGRIIRWIVSILFALAALGAMASHKGFGAFCCIIIFLLWLPPLEDYLEQKKLLMPVWVRVLLTLVFLALIGAGSR